MADFTPYSSGAPFFGAKPSWIPNALDQARVQSYELYERIYWNHAEVFKVSMRGANEAPIYIPAGRTIVNTTNQYTAPKFGVVTRDAVTGQPTDDAVAAQLAINDLMDRERFRSKFSGNKRYGLIRGDWIWHVTADPQKEPGKRISIVALDPSMYFPIPDPNNIERTLGCHLAEEVTEGKDPAIRRQTYRKTESGGVTVEDAIYPIDGWDQDTVAPLRVLRPVTQLPPAITTLPVFHIKNFEEPNNPFGSSELRGLEQLMRSLNQTMSDEDLSLAIVGVGMYATDGNQPTDDRGNKLPWRLGPGQVVHTDGTFFNRVAGITSVAPYGEHYNRTWEALKQASATPDVAVGAVDVQVASSGIALALQLSPMLAKAGEKNELILETHTQMWWTIVNQWFAAYEATTFTNVTVSAVCGDAVPVDRAARFAELGEMLDRGVIDTVYYRSEAEKLGYAFPEDIGTKAAAEYAERNQDQFVSRVAAEAGAPDTGGESDGGA